MGTMRFDGKTAIITGAGGNPSLGRAHAMLLASRGANVVVNDIGGKGAGPGPAGTASADDVVAEIVAAGGKAVADTNSVATSQGAASIAQTALDAFGGIDILINNAGVILTAGIDELTLAHLQLQMEVNLLGPMYLARAVWPRMKERGYGRIVNIASSSMFGCALQVNYGTSKAGVLGFTRALAAEGERYGIKVNAVAPGAFTRMLLGAQEEGSMAYEYSKAHMPPELVSPAIASLAHEGCPVNGECFEVMGGTMRRIYFGRTVGIADPAMTPESIHARWDEIMAGPEEDIVPIAEMDGYAMDHLPYIPGE